MLNLENVKGASFTIGDEWMLVTTFDDGEHIKKYLSKGATVLLVKSSHLNQPTGIIDGNSNDGRITPIIEPRPARHFQLIRVVANELKLLSSREEEVLKLIASGLCYRAVGEKLAIGETTVRTYVKNICSKMQARNRIEAVAMYTTKCFQSPISSTKEKRRLQSNI